MMALVLSWAMPAHAGGDFTDAGRYVFVPLAGSTTVVVVDSRNDGIAGQLDAGLVVSQLESSADLARLAAIDGTSARMSVIDLAGGASLPVDLDFVPQRLLVAGKGVHAVAARMDQGVLAFVDLSRGVVTGRLSGLAPIRDLLFSADGSVVYAAMLDRDSLTVIDVASARLAGEVAPPQAGLGTPASLTRTPSGRGALVRAGAAPVISLVALHAAQASGSIQVGPGVARAYPNATGIHLIVPDNQARTVTFVSAASLKHKATLAGAAGMSNVYSGWFDTVAFVASTDERKLLTYDQPGLERGDDIKLPAAPGRGTVTPDGKKLFLPLADDHSLAVIDAERRRLAGTIPLPGAPTVALMARTFGICH